MIHAAGTLILTGRDGNALFLKRGPGGDHPGEWCFPGGKIEGGETAEEAAERETREEIGSAPYGNPVEWTRRIADNEIAGPASQLVNPALPAEDAIVVSGEPVDFTTFIARAESEFIPKLSDEHTAWTWASVSDPPEPLHPGARVALARLTMDELGIARAMAAGDLTSPQKYGNIWLFSIRITGTGLAYRLGHEEFCWRDPSLYCDPEFLARCNGLPVILDHPEKKPSLDSKEFRDRIIGTVFVPFVQGDEVWAVCRIYYDPAIKAMSETQMSTSPAVVFRDVVNENESIKLSDGNTLLIEGKPALLDHIAVCANGVWDLGGAPTGVLNNLLNQGTTAMTAEETAAADKARNDATEKLDAIMSVLKSVNARMDSIETGEKARKDAEDKERADKSRHDAARKDRFGARKDGESFKDWKGRHDADEASMFDSLRKDGDDEEAAKKVARDCRKDSEDDEKEKGGKEFEDWAKEEMDEPNHREDKARKDAEEKERADKARHDATMSENADVKAQLAALTATLRGLTAETPANERDALAATQARADSVAAMFGDRASAPIPGERPLDYRRRQLARFQRHSARFKESRFDALDDGALGAVEDIVYADAMAVARAPGTASVGTLVPIVTREGGRDITRFHGDIGSWMQHFQSGAQVGRFNRNPKGA